MASALAQRRTLGDRHRTLILLGAAFAWATWRAGITDDIVNGRGWPNLGEFWAAIARPELGVEFVRLTLDASIVTLAYALLGTALAVMIGILGALATSELVWGDHRLRAFVEAAFAVPRAIHEVIWALLLVQIFGFDPLVAVFAIGVPFGAVTAKVLAEALDETDRSAFRQLRATGAGRLSALLYGTTPLVQRDVLAYSFYRFECAVRSAAVLGVVGVGGLGFQLDLSFESLRYEEIWTLIAALMILSGLIDRWSSAVRRSQRSSNDASIGRSSIIAVAIAIPAAAAWVRLDPTLLWSERSRTLAADLLSELVRPRLGPRGWSGLGSALIDTLALSILALVIAAVGGLAAAVVARRRPDRSSSAPSKIAGFAMRILLLLARAVPAPIWVFLAVLVLFPGLWPGAVGLGLYNLGVVGRLFADVFEDQETGPVDQLTATGASPIAAFLYAALPGAAPRLVALALYRWEVIVRETVVVGVVGAGGLGVLINDHLVARDFRAVSGAVLALVALTIAVDQVGVQLRRSLR